MCANACIWLLRWGGRGRDGWGEKWPAPPAVVRAHRYIFLLYSAVAKSVLAVEEEEGGLFRHPQYLNNVDCGKKTKD